MTIETLIVMPVLVFLAFTVLSSGIFFIRHGLIAQAAYQSLERMRMDGLLTVAEQQRLMSQLAQYGCPDPVFHANTPMESRGDAPARRGEPVRLDVGCPLGPSFGVSALVGLAPPDQGRQIRVGGVVLSEVP